MEKKDPLVLLVGMQTGATTVENSMEVPQKVKNRSALSSSNCTTGYSPKKYHNTNAEGYIHPYVYCSIIYNSQRMEVAQCPSTDEWIKKLWFIYTMEYYLAMRNLAICSNVDGIGGYY